MIVSAADTRVLIVDAYASFIDDRCSRLELQLRADLAATGPPDDDALDAPPNPDAAWSAITIEEIISMERRRLESCRDEVLQHFDRRHQSCV